MKPHYQNDKVLQPVEVAKVEKQLNSHTFRLVKVFKMGEISKQTRRTKSYLVTENNPIPVLSGTIKDHKKVSDPKIGPEMRPIMGATFAPNTGLGQIGCEFLRAILENSKSKAEIRSTEEMLNVFQQYNEKVDLTNPESKSELKVVGSMDIKSFYPSIRPDKVALIARLMWNKSDCSVKNVDKEKLAMYVTKEIPREKLRWLNLEDYLYIRKPVTKKIGRKQNKSLNAQDKSLKVKVKRRKKTDDEIWFKPLKSPSETEVKTMVGLVLENIIKISMKNHLYQFANQVRVQENTGPTGYDLTGLVADVYMVWWDERFSQRLFDLKWKIDINVRFKDDLNILTRALPLGAHYC